MAQQSGSCKSCSELAAQLARSEQKRERLKTSMQRLRSKMMDTAKVISLYETVKQQNLDLTARLAPLEAQRTNADTANRQYAEVRRKLEEAREELADKECEIKELHSGSLPSVKYARISVPDFSCALQFVLGCAVGSTCVRQTHLSLRSKLSREINSKQYRRWSKQSVEHAKPRIDYRLSKQEYKSCRPSFVRNRHDSQRRMRHCPRSRYTVLHLLCAKKSAHLWGASFGRDLATCRRLMQNQGTQILTHQCVLCVQKFVRNSTN